MSNAAHDVLIELLASGQIDSLEAELSAMEAAIHERAQAGVADAVTKVEGSPELARIRSALPPLREAALRYKQAVDAVARDPKLSAMGRDDARNRAAAERDAAIGRIRDTLVQNVEALRSKFSSSAALAAPSADLSAEAMLYLASFQYAQAPDILRDALSLLRSATTARAAEQFRANTLLVRAFSPYIRNHGNFVDEYQSLARRIASCVDEHIVTTLDRAADELARDLGERALQQFKWAVDSIEQNGWDEMVTPLMIPVLAAAA